MLATAGVLSDKGIDFLKLHHLHVVRGSALEKEYREKPFHLLELDEYVDLAIDVLERLNPAVRMERLYGTAPQDRLIGPVWNCGRSGVRHMLESRLRERDTWQGRLYKPLPETV